MYCINCGREMPDTTGVCPFCGQPVKCQGNPPAKELGVYTPPGLGGEDLPLYTPPVVCAPLENSDKPWGAPASTMPDGTGAPVFSQPAGSPLAPPAVGQGETYSPALVSQGAPQGAQPFAQQMGMAPSPQGAVPPPVQPYGGGSMPPPPPYTAGQQTSGAPGWGGPAISHPGPQSPVPPDPARRKRTLLVALIAGAVALVVLIVALAVYAVGRSNPKRAVLSALAESQKTVAMEVAKTTEQLGFGAFEALRNGPAKMEMDMGFATEDGYSGLERVNVNMGVLANLPQRRMDVDFGMGMAGTSLLSGTLSFDDDVIALSLPDLYRGSYGVHTATLGADFNKSNLRGMMNADQVDPALSFNYFDMIHTGGTDAGDTVQAGQFSAEMLNILSKMWDGSTVENAGKRTESVNGYNRDCQVYAVTIPQAVARTFVRDLAGYIEESGQDTDELSRALEDAYGGSAYPGYGTGDTVYALEELEASLSGDVTCGIYVCDGRAVVMDAVLPLDLDYSIRLELGGEQHLSDAFFLEVADEYDTLLQASARGNHVMEEGVFSTAVEVQGFDSYEESLVDVLNMEVYYDSNSAMDNFESSFRFSSPDYYDEFVYIAVKGTADVFEDGVSYDFYDVTIEDGMDTMEASLLLTLSPAEAADFKDQAPTMILDMKLMELTELQEEIEENAMALLLRWMSLTS